MILGIALALLTQCLTEAFYVPGVAPVEFQKMDAVEVKVFFF